MSIPYWRSKATLAGTPAFSADPRRACANHPVDDFFPEPRDHEAVRAAIRICVTCMFRADCLLWSIEHNMMFGVYGGVRQQERAKLRKRLLRKRYQAQLARRSEPTR